MALNQVQNNQVAVQELLVPYILNVNNFENSSLLNIVKSIYKTDIEIERIILSNN